ncbi:chemotaxis protein CheB [Shewanella nanhaiensis]|uniref:protein-glutamate methylesterase n=1 Tax=Shewanella nanhaiensis TaxID=2864872 RepID=A0ABS7E3A1_9GAMM|nr:chemotaxis protein CheB [Shewanella nanhaiensis]MBW8183838.1 chemotaxis protein CheB [Shewanella nanhaiensis]
MFEAIVIGVSAGGLKALTAILPVLPSDFPLAVIVVQHRHRDSDNFLDRYLDDLSSVRVKEAEPGEVILPSYVYIAPAGYHLLIERDKTLSLSIDPPVNFSIPSIDVLFESAAACYKNHLIGLILTGANSDGSQGLKLVKDYGGYAIVQAPETAEVDVMPKAAIDLVDVDKVIPLQELGVFLAQEKFSSNVEMSRRVLNE